MLDWRIHWGNIHNDFIVNLFLIWCFTLIDFCLRNFEFDVSSWEFRVKGGWAVRIRKSFFDVLKSYMWRNSYLKEFLYMYICKNVYTCTYCIYAVLFRFNSSPKKSFVSCDYCFWLVVCQNLIVSKTNVWTFISKYPDKIY